MDNQKPDIMHLAKLANITLTQEEYIAFSQNFDDVLSFLKSITESEISVQALSKTADFLREDEASVDCSREELLANAATTADGYITVPLVMEDL